MEMKWGEIKIEMKMKMSIPAGQNRFMNYAADPSSINGGVIDVIDEICFRSCRFDISVFVVNIVTMFFV